jgi:hypothetical protein
MRKTSGDEGCHSTNAVPRHGVCAVTGPRMLVFAYTSFHAFVVGTFLFWLDKGSAGSCNLPIKMA